MTYTTALGSLCDDLTELLEHGGAVPPGELPGAVVARDAILAAVAQSYVDLAGVAPAAIRTPTLDAIVAHPVAVLRLMLARPPTPFTDLRPPEPDTRAGDLWANAARNASLMQHAWSNSDPGSWPAGPARWTAIADLAAITEAVAILDGDLLPTQVHPGALPPGLRIGAREVRSLAGAGELAPVAELRPQPTRPVRVRALEDVAGAEIRLATLLTRAEHLDPANVRQIARAHRRTVLVLARATDDLGDQLGDSSSAIAGRLFKHADALRLDDDRRLASVRPGDPRPLAQAEEIELFAARWDQRGHGAPLDAVPTLAAARCALHATQALGTAVEKQTATGNWVVPDSECLALRWIPVHRDAQTPRTVSVMRRASLDATAALATDELRPSQPPHSRTAPERASTRLTSALASAFHRPQDPADRPGVRPAR